MIYLIGIGLGCGLILASTPTGQRKKVATALVLILSVGGLLTASLYRWKLSKIRTVEPELQAFVDRLAHGDDDQVAALFPAPVNLERLKGEARWADVQKLRSLDSASRLLVRERMRSGRLTMLVLQAPWLRGRLPGEECKPLLLWRGESGLRIVGAEKPFPRSSIPSDELFRAFELGGWYQTRKEAFLREY